MLGLSGFLEWSGLSGLLDLGLLGLKYLARLLYFVYMNCKSYLSYLVCQTYPGCWAYPDGQIYLACLFGIFNVSGLSGFSGLSYYLAHHDFLDSQTYLFRLPYCDKWFTKFIEILKKRDFISLFIYFCIYLLPYRILSCSRS